MISRQAMGRLLLLVSMLLALSALFSTGVTYNNDFPANKLQRVSNDRYQVVLFEEDFINGLGDWESQDGTAPYHWNEWWHASEVGAYEGSSWWMGDESIDGYQNHRYIIIDTDDIVLPQENASMDFMLSFNLEPASEHDDYDAWDGFNVRISNDSGETWQIIEGSPAYTATSCYSFGEIFEEGTGVPGWTGSSEGWQEASFDLSAWAGQTVRVRFAFASDDNSCTIDEDGDPSWFGARIDNINIGDAFFSNADGVEDDARMIPWYSSEMSGDFWEAAIGYEGGLSAHCPIENSLVDEIISPAYSLHGDIHYYFSYRVLCDIPDTDSDQDGILDDYYTVYVKALDDLYWTRIHYNHADGSPAEWTYIDNDYAQAHFADQNGNCDLGVWAGQTVQFKFQLNTDNDGNAQHASGLYIDDFKIYYEFPLAEPENLQAYPSGQTIQLLWDNPTGGAQEGWMHWDDGIIDNFLGADGPADIDVCARFFAEDLLPYVGYWITAIKFAPGEQQCDYWIRIWSGDGTILREQYVEYPSIGGWNRVTLQEPLQIEFGNILWIGYRALAEAGYPCGCDVGPMVPGKGGFVRVNGGDWVELYYATTPATDSNLNIQALVESDDGRPVPISVTRSSRAVEGYQVFRRSLGGSFGEPIANLSGENNTFFIDQNPPTNTILEYAVKAIYEQAASDFCEPVQALALAQTAIEYKSDDGTAESTATPGVAEEIAITFNMEERRQLKYAKVFIDEMSDLPFIFKLWDCASTGEPELMIEDFAISSSELTTGWNYISIPGQPVLDARTYAISVMGTAVSYGIGEDTTEPQGMSFTYSNGGWEYHDAGNYMLRIIADTQIANDHQDIVKPDMAFSNYPNPFNPETTFSFYLSSPEKVRLEIFNIRGQKVVTLSDERMDAGAHFVNWSGQDQTGKPVSGGVYLSRLSTQSNTEMRKVLLLK